MGLMATSMMKSQKKTLFALLLLVVGAVPVVAQYPIIPDSVKVRGERQQAEIDRRSNEAWAKALPAVLAQAEEGRPYKPWASKPEDLVK